MSNLKENFNRIVALTESRSNGGRAQYVGKCPAHDDKNPSLSLTLREDRILVKCHSGCSFEQICHAMGIKESEMSKSAGNDKN